MLFDDVINEVHRILEVNGDLVSEWAAERKRFEPWLQREVYEALNHNRVAVRREQPYVISRAWCDFFATEEDESESWVELKVCATNYAHGFTKPVAGRPITQQIYSVLADIEKLRQLSSEFHRGILLLAYPMPEDYWKHPNWVAHLASISSSYETVTECFSIPLQRNAKSAHLAAYRIDIGRSTMRPMVVCQAAY